MSKRKYSTFINYLDFDFLFYAVVFIVILIMDIKREGFLETFGSYTLALSLATLSLSLVVLIVFYLLKRRVGLPETVTFVNNIVWKCWYIIALSGSVAILILIVRYFIQAI